MIIAYIAILYTSYNSNMIIVKSEKLSVMEALIAKNYPSDPILFPLLLRNRLK